MLTWLNILFSVSYSAVRNRNTSLQFQLKSCERLADRSNTRWPRSEATGDRGYSLALRTLTLLGRIVTSLRELSKWLEEMNRSRVHTARTVRENANIAFSRASTVFIAN